MTFISHVVWIIMTHQPQPFLSPTLTIIRTLTAPDVCVGPLRIELQSEPRSPPNMWIDHPSDYLGISRLISRPTSDSGTFMFDYIIVVYLFDFFCIADTSKSV